MPDWANAALLAVFAVHLAVFACLALRRRQARYAVAGLTFLLLVGVFGLRLWAPEWRVGGTAMHWYLRVAAWLLAAASLTMFVRRRIRAE